MYGAFIGDIVGSKYEFDNIKTKDFPLFSRGCDYTDDTIMTVAVGNALLHCREQLRKGADVRLSDCFVEEMQRLGRKYPYPTGAYGGRFAQWLRERNPAPYNSYGNGSAMRVSPCGLIAVTLEEAQMLAYASAEVTHNHPEGIKGAVATASAVFLAKAGKSKEEIRDYIEEHFYSLDMTVEELRKTYSFDGSCQGSVPQALVCFFESTGFEDAIRNVISIGGDCDTTGAITGSVAYVYYAVQENGYSGWANGVLSENTRSIKEQAMKYLPREFMTAAYRFHEICWKRAGTYYRTGFCSPVLSEAEAQRLRPLIEKMDFMPEPPASVPEYTLAYLEEVKRKDPYSVWHDICMKKWRYTVSLDKKRIWFLSVFINDDGSFDKYCLDQELANDSHFEFQDEDSIRAKIYAKGDEEKLFHEVLLRYTQEKGADAAYDLIRPYITAAFHF